jgi:hypothetical protein
MDTKIETQMVHSLSVTMSESEWREVLVDAKPLLARVRSELATLHAGNDRNTVKPKGNSKTPKGKPPATAHRKHQIGTTKCQYCGEMISNVGINRHVKKCAQSNAGHLLSNFAPDADSNLSVTIHA